MKALSLVLVFVFLIIGIGYAMGWLQFFVHEPGTHHIKHAILAWVLALLSLIWFRFQSSPQPSR